MTKRDKLIKPSLPKGTRDFLPAQVRKREKVISLVKTVFERYGYEPLETPALENLEVLSGKYGEEGERLIFKILKRGEELKQAGLGLTGQKIDSLDYSALADLGLRYDLTVPLARVIASYQNQIKLPFKRYQIQPVWRGDRPQKGRYREFYQCDVDVVGTASLLADAEIIQISHEILKALGFDNFRIRLNHRSILAGVIEYCGVEKDKAGKVTAALDKFEKIGRSGVIEELKSRGVSKSVCDRLMPFFDIRGDNRAVLDRLETFLEKSETGTRGVKETRQLLDCLKLAELPESACSLDLYLARGLEYYTGPIFESVVDRPKIGSLTGGGRYDRLIGMFLGREIPATGTTIGFERIVDVMTELELLQEAGGNTQVLMTIFNPDTESHSIRVASKLRKAGVNCEVYLEEQDSLREQIGYANSKGIRLVVIIGPQEAEQQQALLKDLIGGKQTVCQQSGLAEEVLGRLSE
jgi:histidyl-tRNA synthetase